MNEQSSHLPQHIAIVMDGNGRWAKKRLMPRIAGHRAGVKAARQVVKNCVKKNIRVLSLFAFSSENWQRPSTEVNYLMGLFLNGLEREFKVLNENNIQLRFIGNRTRFTEGLIQKIHEVELLTQGNTGMILIIAADYGGQWDICQAVRQLGKEIESGDLTSAAITPQLLASRLSFADLPDPDLLIRTSGELRLSNFMLWQLAYTELYFTETYWPDFDANELEKALLHYANRERRFGRSGEQINEEHHA